VTNLSGILDSGLVRQLLQEVGLVASVAAVVLFWNEILVDRIDSLPKLLLPIEPFTLSSPALGLLLVFRTNGSYFRWSEARMRWGLIINHARNTVRTATTWAPSNDPEANKLLDRVAVGAWAFSRAVMNKLTGPDDDADFLRELQEQFASIDELSELAPRIMAAPEPTMAAFMYLSLAVNDLDVSEIQRVEIDKSVVILGDCLGACERIFSSPVPLVYTRHTARFLSLWMLLLPLAMYEPFMSRDSAIFALPMIPAAAILSVFLFGIEELAVQLEEPFSILPMQQFCDGILGAGAGLRDWSVESRKQSSENDMVADDDDDDEDHGNQSMAMDPFSRSGSRVS